MYVYLLLIVRGDCIVWLWHCYFYMLYVVVVFYRPAVWRWYVVVYMEELIVCWLVSWSVNWLVSWSINILLTNKSIIFDVHIGIITDTFIGIILCNKLYRYRNSFFCLVGIVFCKLVFCKWKFTIDLFVWLCWSLLFDLSGRFFVWYVRRIIVEIFVIALDLIEGLWFDSWCWDWFDLIGLFGSFGLIRFIHWQKHIVGFTRNNLLYLLFGVGWFDLIWLASAVSFWCGAGFFVFVGIIMDSVTLCYNVG